MKNFFMLFGLVAFIFFSPLHAAYATNIKIGVVDFQKINQSSRAVKANETLQKQFSPEWDKIVVKQKALNELTSKMKRDETIMSEKEKKQLKGQVESSQKELATLSEDFRKKFSTAQRDMVQKLMSDVRNAIEKVASKNQIEFVVPQEILLYAKESVDLTQKVINSL